MFFLVNLKGQFMDQGNWIPIDKNAAQFLPKDRPFTKLEAIFSIQVDHNTQNKRVSVSGYAKLWEWSRKKVRCFLDTIGVEVIYPEDTKLKQNQKGQIRGQIRDRSTEKKGQIRFTDNKALQTSRDRSENEKEQIRDRSGATTRNNNNNNNIIYISAFEKFWNSYNKKIARGKCENKWDTLPQADKDDIFKVLSAYVTSTPDKQYRKNPLTYLNNDGWKDEILQPKNKQTSSQGTNYEDQNRMGKINPVPAERWKGTADDDVY
jgi:hypothetical protein